MMRADRKKQTLLIEVATVASIIIMMGLIDWIGTALTSVVMS